MSSAEVANPIIPLPPRKDEGAPQSPSNPIEIEQENTDILPDNNDSTDNILGDEINETEYETKQSDTQDPQEQDTNAHQTEEAIDDDGLPIPNHRRANADVSTNKITSIMNEMEVPQINLNNDEKVNTTQKRVLKIEYGHCSLQGIRPSMEDCVVEESSFTVYDSKCTSNNLSIYGVFDGHGGKQCAQYCAHHLCDILTKYLRTESSVEKAFELCISELDEKAIDFSKDASGSTACIILIDNIRFDLYCCNVGDSRSILINHSHTNVEQLSIEHKPEYPKEKKRIENANGWVTFGRVCGILAVSRSLGDKDFKYEIENLIISTPDVTHHKLVFGEDKYIVLACDGLYDVFTNEQCMEWIKNTTINDNDTNECDMQDITDKLCNDAIYVRKSKDNVSVLILRIDSDTIEINENEINDFDGTELNIDEDENDEVKDCEKIYNSASSNGSVGSPNNHSLQSQMSNQSNESDDKMENKPTKTKHKFHVVMESDDTIDKLAQNISEESK